MALLRLERLGIPRFHRQSRHGDWLAAEGLWPVLELEDSPWQARPPRGAETRSPVDPYAQPRKSTMGRSPHSRRTAQARHPHRRDQRHQVHGPARLPPSQAWRTFLDNHLKTMVSVDFLVVPTITGANLLILKSCGPDPKSY